MDEVKRTWGHNVACGRKALGLTQARLAELCSVTQQTISAIESGTYAPRDGLKVRIAEQLHQDVRQLFPLMRVAV